MRDVVEEVGNSGASIAVISQGTTFYEFRDRWQLSARARRANPVEGSGYSPTVTILVTIPFVRIS